MNKNKKFNFTSAVFGSSNDSNSQQTVIKKPKVTIPNNTPQTVYTIDHIRILSIGLELRSLQWRLMWGNILKSICIGKDSPAVASIASLFQSNTENTNMV